MKFERRPYQWRMFDPWVMRLERQRAPFVRLGTVLRIAHVRARMAGQRRGPNKNGRHFHPLCTDMLDARREGVSGRIMRGAGR